MSVPVDETVNGVSCPGHSSGRSSVDMLRTTDATGSAEGSVESMTA
ncbi:hypothetical protein CZ674_06790 [Agrococcus casei LMG 22410]|uniref:Uncharacterized protein n=1 Tax=Agrococcus casei LMG 22410 TaxID=1255656 RepID=A0A1R4FUX2_9MICO|nr:hypothetical protein CZ674_06790 [Agrococcus casei LMG 22410]